MFTTMTSFTLTTVFQQPEELDQRNFFLDILTPKQCCIRRLGSIRLISICVKNRGTDLTFSNWRLVDCVPRISDFLSPTYVKIPKFSESELKKCASDFLQGENERLEWKDGPQNIDLCRRHLWAWSKRQSCFSPQVASTVKISANSRLFESRCSLLFHFGYRLKIFNMRFGR